MLSNDSAPVNTGALYLALIYVRPGQQEALRRYENLPSPSSAGTADGSSGP
jgi:hypothetical protein